MREINEIIIHCSDSENGDAKTITQWHLARGWNTIGYHYVIKTDGSVEIGRDITQIGSHCKGHNTGSVGICLIGVDVFNMKQLESLYNLIIELKNKYNITSIVGHCYYDKNKTCPNFDVDKFKSQWGL